MANINPRGPTTTTGRNQVLANGDQLTAANQILGATGVIGVTGLQGATGIGNTNQGATGIGIPGFTGIRGFTGVLGEQGFTGILGATGLSGVTGLHLRGVTGIQGETGIKGTTGITSPSGITGVGGYTGLVGHTGLTGETGITGHTGVAILGFTGLRGDTGLHGETGVIGVTGVAQAGYTGLTGFTGLEGATGLLDLISLDIQQQLSGVTLAYVVVSAAIPVAGQQLEFYSSGLTATDGSATTITAKLGSYTIFSDSISLAGGADIMLYGLVNRVGDSAQETTVRLLSESAECLAQWSSINVDFSLTPSLAISLSSTGTGHIIYTLVVRRLEEAADSA
jgi:hypothetical protein